MFRRGCYPFGLLKLILLLQTYLSPNCQDDLSEDELTVMNIYTAICSLIFIMKIVVLSFYLYVDAQTNAIETQDPYNLTDLEL